MDRCTSAPWHKSQSGSRLIDHGAAPSSSALAPQKSALVVRGPQEVKKRELVFLQLSLNGSSEDFSAIRYLLFSSFHDFMQSPNRAGFMQACESAYSGWRFSGGFRTWVKMSLVKTQEEDGREAVEFRQETSVVNYIDRRPEAEKHAQLFFVVFEWKDPYIQKVQDIITANPWNTIALLCGAFLALFKAAEFAKLSVKWTIKVRRRYLKKRLEGKPHRLRSPGAAPCQPSSSEEAGFPGQTAVSPEGSVGIV